MFIKNKYYRWYYQIVDKARKRGVPDEYYEKHHIIPECLGGKNTEWNLVKLTFREHYLVHWFLIKMTEDEAKRKMFHALFRMNGISSSNQGRKSPSWLYTLAKKAAREARLGYKYSDDAKLKMRNSHLGKQKGEKNGFFGRKHSAENLEKFRNQKHSAETLEKLRKVNLGRKASEETKLKMSLKLKGRKDSEETRLKKSGKNHPMYGKNHTAEAREKIRVGLRGKMTGKDNPFYGKKHKIESLVTMRKEPSVRSKSGLRGISKLKNGSYSARIRLDGKVEYLGYFKTSDEAALAYKMALSRIEGAL